MSVSKGLDLAVFYHIKVSEKHESAELLWRRDVRRGVRIVILSTFGDWSFYWSHPGEDAEAFLAKLGRDYMGNKLMGSRYLQTSVSGTGRIVKKLAIEYRRDRTLTKEEAREEYELGELMTIGDAGIETFMNETKIEDAAEYICKTADQGWCNFWETLWVPLIQPRLLAS